MLRTSIYKPPMLVCSRVHYMTYTHPDLTRTSLFLYCRFDVCNFLEVLTKLLQNW